MQHYISIVLTPYGFEDFCPQSYMFRTDLSDDELLLDSGEIYNSAEEIFTPNFYNWLKNNTSIIAVIEKYSPNIYAEYGEFNEFKEIKF